MTDIKTSHPVVYADVIAILQESPDCTILKVRLYRYAIKATKFEQYIKDLVEYYTDYIQDLEAHNLPPNWLVSL